jgi:hypothetical protein
MESFPLEELKKFSLVVRLHYDLLRLQIDLKEPDYYEFVGSVSNAVSHAELGNIRKSFVANINAISIITADEFLTRGTKFHEYRSSIIKIINTHVYELNNTFWKTYEKIRLRRIGISR